MSQDDETISGSDLAIMKTSRLKWNKNIFQNSHFITKMKAHLYSRTPTENLNRSTETLFLLLDFLLNGRNGNFYNK